MPDTTETEQSIDQSEMIELSAGWAALKRGVVAAYIPMRKFNDVDFEQFREQSRALLAMMGDLKTGNLITQA